MPMFLRFYDRVRLDFMENGFDILSKTFSGLSDMQNGGSEN